MLILCAYDPYMRISCVYAHILRKKGGGSAMCAAAQNAQRQSPSRESQKRIIFLRILEQEGETSKNQ